MNHAEALIFELANRPEWAFLASCFEPLGSCRSKREELVELMPAMIKFEA
jgi:hypothetical protein